MWSSDVILLIGHVAAAVLLIGPVTVATSAFPRQVRLAGDGDVGAASVAEVLHRISRSYGLGSIAVGVIGIALTADGDWWSAAWLQASIVLYVVGLVVLFGRVLPMQRQLLALAGEPSPVPAPLIGRMHMAAGLYATTWLATLVLMVGKPT